MTYHRSWDCEYIIPGTMTQRMVYDTYLRMAGTYLLSCIKRGRDVLWVLSLHKRHLSSTLSLLAVYETVVSSELKLKLGGPMDENSLQARFC